MNTNIIFLEKAKRGKRTYYINGMNEKVWYDNYEGLNTNETFKIKSESILCETFMQIGSVGNIWFNTLNWGFEMENNRFYAFSHGSYAVIWDKYKKEYIKVSRYGKRSKFHKNSIFTEMDIIRFCKVRLKRGQRFC